VQERAAAAGRDGAVRQSRPSPAPPVRLPTPRRLAALTPAPPACAPAPRPAPRPQSNSATQKYLESYEADRDAARAAKAAAKAEGDAKAPDGAAAEGEGKADGGGGGADEMSDEQKDDLALSTIMEIVTEREAAAVTRSAVHEVLSVAAGGGERERERDRGAPGTLPGPAPVLGGKQDGARLDDR
jgi:hypothetical protein